MVINFFLEKLNPALTYRLMLLHALLKLHLFTVFTFVLLTLFALLVSHKFLCALLCFEFMYFSTLLSLHQPVLLVLEFAIQKFL